MGSLLLSIVNYYTKDGEKIFDGNYYFDNNAESFIYAAIGLLVVFAGILILIGILMLVGFLFKKLEEKGILNRKTHKSKKSAQKASEAAAASLPAVSAEDSTQEEIPDEVKAAIIATIMAYYQTAQPKCEFTVKRIKRI